MVFRLIQARLCQASLPKTRAPKSTLSVGTCSESTKGDPGPSLPDPLELCMFSYCCHWGLSSRERRAQISGRLSTLCPLFPPLFLGVHSSLGLEGREWLIMSAQEDQGTSGALILGFWDLKVNSWVILSVAEWYPLCHPFSEQIPLF